MQVNGKLGRLGIAALAAAALTGGSAAYAGPTTHAQAPQSVPVARFYGRVTVSGGIAPTNATISAFVGPRLLECAGVEAVPGGIGNRGVDSAGNYSDDIQAAPGCTTPGDTVTFTLSSGSFGTMTAAEKGTIPALPGTAVHLDLHFTAITPTPTARPATPTPAPSTPPPSTAPSTPPPVATTARPPAASPVAQRGVAQAPKGPVGAQGPAVAPRLPNTGTGGLLDQSSSSPPQAGWALALVLLAALALGTSGIVALRRGRS